LGGRGQGGTLIAQNWLDLSGERGLSNFDQRHTVNATLQYTTGMGVAGGTLVGGWRGAAFKGLDVRPTAHRGHGDAADAHLSGRRQRHRRDREHPADYTGAPLYSDTGAATSIPRHTPHRPPASGATPGGIPSPGRRSSA